MSETFLDTSVILCGFHPTELYKDKARILVQREFLLSPITHSEIKNIKGRRFSIYLSISSIFKVLSTKPAPILTVDDIYRRCFKANFGDNIHDTNHLKSLFSYIKDELELNDDSIVDAALLQKIALKVNDVFNDIQYNFIKLINDLDNPIVYQRRVVTENIGNKYSKLLTLFKKIKDYKSHKNDVKILIHAVEYSCYTNINLQIISNDNYMVDIKEEVVSNSKRIFSSLYYTIYHLKDYVIT